ncbi:TPA: hypothetical protein NNT57_004569 [Salmonella enterica]|nr:hypothetical protein [Salmonella enterica]HCH9143030.1 hypothetical protein [Salmonella enterica]
MVEMTVKKLDDYDCNGLMTDFACDFYMKLGAAHSAFDLWRMGDLSTETTERLLNTFINDFEDDIARVHAHIPEKERRNG